MRLLAEPAAGLVDEPPTWRVEDVAAGSPVELRLTTTDGEGRHWRSVGTYRVGGDGRLAVTDLDQPWAGMQPSDADGPPVTFTAPQPVWTVSAEASCAGEVARTEVRRLYGEDLLERVADGDGWRLAVFSPPDAQGPRPAVLVVPGSTGVAAMAPTARLLAAHGYPAAVLAYMQEPGLPQTLDRIPVEVVSRGLEAFGEADPARTAVWAVSVGTELALSALAAPGAPAVRAVIAVAPSDVVWQALSAGGPPPKRSSVSAGGTELPWLALRGEAVLGQVAKNAVMARLPGRRRSTALRLHDAYAKGRRDSAALDQASIPVERITAPMLVIAGEADAMWPATEMATRIIERRRSAGFENGAGDELVLLPEAGHFCRPPATPTTVDRNRDLISGGTPDGNAAGQRRAWDTALAFLRRTLAS